MTKLVDLPSDLYKNKLKRPTLWLKLQRQPKRYKTQKKLLVNQRV